MSSKIQSNRTYQMLLFAGLLSVFCCHAGTLSFATIPSSGDIAGSPGTDIGWGYTLANTSMNGDWLVTTGLSSDAFLYGVPNLFFDFPVLEPGTSLSVPFSDVNFTGLYQLVWDTSAPIGFINIGSFQLNAQWWSDDPFNGGTYLADAVVPALNYTAEVVVPEPWALWTLSAAFALLFTYGKIRVGLGRPC